MTLKQKVYRVIEFINGPEAIGAANMNVLQGYNQRMLSGLEVRPYTGMQGDPSLTFSGPLTSPQRFIGGTQMGSQGLAIPLDVAVALPSTAMPYAVLGVPEPNWSNFLGWDG